MNFAYYIAQRYLVSKKSQNVINIISAISVTGVAVGTMALIIVLSVFNGFENLVISLYNSFDPEVKITIREGKTFDQGLVSIEKIKQVKGIKYISPVLEENALLDHNEKQYIATIKGVENDFILMTGLDSMLSEGKLLLKDKGVSHAIVGQGVAYYLGLSLQEHFKPLNIYVPSRSSGTSPDSREAFNVMSIFPSGIFSIQQDFDSKYVIVPLEFAHKLFDYTGRISAFEIGLEKNADQTQVITQLKNIFGPKFNVRDRYQQHELLYKIMKSEKWAVFLILTFILIIATFNVISSLTMPIIDKQKDITILWSMGADTSLIRKIFMIEGMLITLTGALAGLLAGLIICLIQQQFGIIKLGGSGTFVIDAYPVNIQAADFVYILLTVMLIGFIAAWYPAKNLIKENLFSRAEL